MSLSLSEPYFRQLQKEKDKQKSLSLLSVQTATWISDNHLQLTSPKTELLISTFWKTIPSLSLNNAISPSK